MAAIGNQSLKTPWLFTADTIAQSVRPHVRNGSYDRAPSGGSGQNLPPAFSPCSGHPHSLAPGPATESCQGRTRDRWRAGAPAWSRQERSPGGLDCRHVGMGVGELHQALHTAVTLLRCGLHLSLAGVQSRDILVTLSNCTTITINPFGNIFLTQMGVLLLHLFQGAADGHLLTG